MFAIYCSHFICYWNFLCRDVAFSKFHLPPPYLRYLHMAPLLWWCSWTLKLHVDSVHQHPTLSFFECMFVTVGAKTGPYLFFSFYFFSAFICSSLQGFFIIIYLICMAKSTTVLVSSSLLEACLSTYIPLWWSFATDPWVIQILLKGLSFRYPLPSYCLKYPINSQYLSKTIQDLLS